MGLSIDRETFTEADRVLFGERLRESLAALEQVLSRPGFGQGERSVGAEVELALVDARGRALPLNRDVLARSLDEHLQLELDRFNLEYNLSPVPMRGRPFSSMLAELVEALVRVDAAADAHGGDVLMIGILPTLSEPDLTASAMTDLPRYRALSRAIRELRGGAVEVVIGGEEPLAVTIDDVTMEGAATSLQVHLRADPGEFAHLYNAAQLATGPALAAAVNSPLFLGHRLWSETRVALFKQAVDAHLPDERDWQRPPRVSFGRGWVREGAHELFAETVCLFPPLLACVAEERPLDRIAEGVLPTLSELRLHHGTVWRWNRSIYDPAGGGHLRIELRALPSGPTAVDSVANAAFVVGLSLGLAEAIPRLLPALPFDYVARNFYRAAEAGLDADFIWADPGASPSLHQWSARELCLSLFPVAQAGLEAAGVDSDEAEDLLAVVRGRVESGQTGARWQLDVLSRLEELGAGRAEALTELTQRYRALSQTGRPVHEWSVEP